MKNEWFIPYKLNYHSIRIRPLTEWTFMEIESDDGISGIAEITDTQLKSSPIPVVTRLANKLRGEKIHFDSEILQLLEISPGDLQTDQVLATAVSGISCAVMDALAKRAGLPLSEYLCSLYGNNHREPSIKIELYANINRSLLPDEKGPVDRSPESFYRMAKRAIQDGYRYLKCTPFDECRAPFSKPGLPEEALIGVERFKAAKKAVGVDKTLYVDCHSRFDLDSAMELEPLLREAGAAWYEEPVDPIHCQKELREIRKRSKLPIAGAEHGYGLDLYRHLVESEVLDIVMPDIKFCGGPFEAYQIGRTLESMKPGTVSLHCPSGPVSLIASGHVTAAFGNILPLEHAVYEVEWRHKIIEPNESIQKGNLQLPNLPGLGITLNKNYIEKYGKQWTA